MKALDRDGAILSRREETAVAKALVRHGAAVTLETLPSFLHDQLHIAPELLDSAFVAFASHDDRVAVSSEEMVPLANVGAGLPGGKHVVTLSPTDARPPVQGGRSGLASALRRASSFAVAITDASDAATVSRSGATRRRLSSFSAFAMKQAISGAQGTLPQHDPAVKAAKGAAAMLSETAPNRLSGGESHPVTSTSHPLRWRGWLEAVLRASCMPNNVPVTPQRRDGEGAVPKGAVDLPLSAGDVFIIVALLKRVAIDNQRIDAGATSAFDHRAQRRRGSDDTTNADVEQEDTTSTSVSEAISCFDALCDMQRGDMVSSGPSDAQSQPSFWNRRRSTILRGTAPELGAQDALPSVEGVSLYCQAEFGIPVDATMSLLLAPAPEGVHAATSWDGGSDAPRRASTDVHHRRLVSSHTTPLLSVVMSPSSYSASTQQPPPHTRLHRSSVDAGDEVSMVTGAAAVGKRGDLHSSFSTSGDLGAAMDTRRRRSIARQSTPLQLQSFYHALLSHGGGSAATAADVTAAGHHAATSQRSGVAATTRQQPPAVDVVRFDGLGRGVAAVKSGGGGGGNGATKPTSPSEGQAMNAQTRRSVMRSLDAHCLRATSSPGVHPVPRRDVVVVPSRNVVVVPSNHRSELLDHASDAAAPQDIRRRSADHQPDELSAAGPDNARQPSYSERKVESSTRRRLAVATGTPAVAAPFALPYPAAHLDAQRHWLLTPSSPTDITNVRVGASAFASRLSPGHEEAPSSKLVRLTARLGQLLHHS